MKVHDKKKGIKWDVIPFQYSSQRHSSGTNCEEVRYRLEKEAAEREDGDDGKGKARELKAQKAAELKALKDKKAAELKALMKTREEKWGELTNNLYQSGGILWLKDEFMHLRLVELEVTEVYDNVKKFIEDLCNNVRTVVLRMLKITGLMSRLGEKRRRDTTWSLCCFSLRGCAGRMPNTSRGRSMGVPRNVFSWKDTKRFCCFSSRRCAGRMPNTSRGRSMSVPRNVFS